MTQLMSLADLVFGPKDGISKQELKRFHKAASNPQVKQQVKYKAPKLKFPSVWQRIRAAFPSIFQIPAADILFYCWEKFSQIGKALYPADGEEENHVTVTLHNHTLESKHNPKVELYCHGNRITSLDLTFIIRLQFESINLVFRRGELFELQPGNCRGNAELSYGSHRIFKRQIVAFSWPGNLRLTQRKTQELPSDENFHSVPNSSSPPLPPLRKKRGLGCFVVVVAVSCLIATAIYVAVERPDIVRELSTEISRLLRSF